MHPSTALVVLAGASQVAFAAPLPLLSTSLLFTPPELQALQNKLPNAKRENIVGEIGADIAKVGEKTIGSSLKSGALSGIGTLIGGAGIGGLLDHFDGSSSTPSSRDWDEYLEARGDVAGEIADDGAKAVAKVAQNSGIGKTIGNSIAGALTSLGVGGAISSLFDHAQKNQAQRREILEYLMARENVVGEVGEEIAKVGEKTIGSSLKSGALSGIGTLIGGAGIGGLLDHFSKSSSSSKREILEYLMARENIVGEVGEEIAKVGEKTIGSSLKNGALSGVGTLIGGAGIGGLLDHFDKSSSSSSRDFDDEYLVARGDVAGEIADDGAKAVAQVAKNSGIGKTIGNSIAGALTSLGVGGAISSLFDHAQKNQAAASKREILEYIEARANEELATRELINALLEAREIDELD
ncbi:hypothetical protein BV25DRAFT_1920354 [Artomyces pyxidatus]|uniref:Uncharacterized protein n=1 Tax=Artomyces pyxidatus TaxID=48021 RepID=A0ACB8SL58_9AGAM|nr:hypothetical protein BV25DRAFT_1920354 [Artomyces pyxidatus]